MLTYSQRDRFVLSIESMKPAYHDISINHFMRWLFASLRNVLSRIYRHHVAVLYELNLNRSDIMPENSDTMPRGYNLRLATLDDLPACAAMAGMKVNEYLRRAKHGDACYITVFENKPVNQSWVRFGSAYIRGIGYYLDNGTGVAYLYNIYSHPVHRRRGLYKTALQHLHQMLTHRGITRLRQIVDNTNAIPLAVLPDFGYKMARRIVHTRVCGLKITVIRDPSGKILSRKIFISPPENVFQI